MRFALDETGTAVGADEARGLTPYRCAGCGGQVVRHDREGHPPRFHHTEAEPADCTGPILALKQAAREQLRTCDRIKLPELTIVVRYPPDSRHALEEEVLVTSERLFQPFGCGLLESMEGGQVDVLYEADEWRLGILLLTPPVEATRFDVNRMAGSKAGVVSINLAMLQFVIGPGARPWREQLRTMLALGGGNKRWVYHPREARLRQEWTERLERKWGFKQYVRQQAPASANDDWARRGAPQAYRCACGEKWMGKAGVVGHCPKCGMPSTGFSIPVHTEGKP